MWWKLNWWRFHEHSFINSLHLFSDIYVSQISCVSQMSVSSASILSSRQWENTVKSLCCMATSWIIHSQELTSENISNIYNNLVYRSANANFHRLFVLMPPKTNNRDSGDKHQHENISKFFNPTSENGQQRNWMYSGSDSTIFLTGEWEACGDRSYDQLIKDNFSPLFRISQINFKKAF